MTIKIVTYLWGLAIACSIILLFVYLPIKVAVYKSKGEKYNSRRTYSYCKVTKMFILIAIILSSVAGIIYFETNSLELSLTFGVFFMACAIAGLIRGLQLESFAKRRGAVKED